MPPSPKSSVPASRMIAAVQVQTTSVSAKTPSACTKPCFTGCETSAVAAAFGADPSPASFEKSPRRTPCITATPTPPPATSRRPKASETISPSTRGSSPRCVTATHAASARNPSAMNGTRTAETRETRRTPPKKTASASAASTAAVAHAAAPVRSPRMPQIALLCTMWLAIPWLSTRTTANATPIGAHLRPYFM